MKIGVLLLFILFWIPLELAAQRAPVVAYQITVITTNGSRIMGYLYDVTDTKLFYTSDQQLFGNELGFGSIPLRDIRRVNIYSGNKRAGTIEGAIVGGAGLAFVAIRYLQRSPLRSPTVTGISILLATVGGAAFGAFLGAIGSNMGRRGFRITRKEGEEQAFKAQLTPFTFIHQNNLPDNATEDFGDQN
ncbi:hypothetical protein [Telluribacter sp.]|uniref:hypothetical protein n=1 Tax=Telluribacter sp. TaxID=1978767 RepID=UPI002E117C78|nr:hypothetical protein [Telluribacter sp.]